MSEEQDIDIGQSDSAHITFTHCHLANVDLDISRLVVIEVSLYHDELSRPSSFPQT